jgi:hypothetical protein
VVWIRPGDHSDRLCNRITTAACSSCSSVTRRVVEKIIRRDADFVVSCARSR